MAEKMAYYYQCRICITIHKSMWILIIIIYLQVSSHVGEKRDWCSVFQVRIQILLEVWGLDQVCNSCVDFGRYCNLW